MSGPFIGMAMSLIFYAVLRGGFLAGTPADEKVVNPFGVVAVGALVGMFADKAALKLRGKRLGKVTMVRFNSTEVKPDFVSDDEVHFTLKPDDLKVPRTLNISVIDPQAGASVSAKLPIVAATNGGPQPPTSPTDGAEKPNPS